MLTDPAPIPANAPQSGTRWTHWKHPGEFYTVDGVGHHSETGELVVAYHDPQGNMWVRPLAMWADEARPGVTRFAPVPRCERCRGNGSVRMNMLGAMGACPLCHGSGNKL